MKKSICILMAALLAAIALTGCAQQSGTDAAPVVKIGVYEPASGENSSGGKQEILGIKYANSLKPTVNIGGKEHEVQLIYVDNESSAEKGEVMAEMLATSGASVILGSYGSNESLAGSPVFEDAGIPVIGTSCTNPEITLHNNHYFRICFLDTLQGEVLAHYVAEDFGAKKVYCLAKQSDNYSSVLCQYFINAFLGLEGEITYETFPEGCVDFMPYIKAAMESGAQAMVAPISASRGALLIEQAAEAGLNIPIIAGDTWDSNVIAAAAKGSNLDIHITTHFDSSSEEQNAQVFVSNFQAWLTSEPDHIYNNGGDNTVSAFSALGYDAYMTAVAAIENAGSTDPLKVMDSIWGTTCSGVTGEIMFDSDHGDAVRTEAFIKKLDAATGSWLLVGSQGVDLGDVSAE